MKKMNLIIISIIMFLMNINVVFAKDTVYSLNKYKEEKFTFIKDSYNISGNKDGLIIGGNVLKETIKNEKNDEEYNDYQVILVKYNKEGKVKWTFTYGKNKEDSIDYLDYTYDENNKIDGYLIIMEKTYDVVVKENTEEEVVNKNQTTYIKVGLDGKIVWEKDSNLNLSEKMIKVVKTYDRENNFVGYIAIGNTKESSIIIKYDKEFNILWQKEYKNSEYSKVENIDIAVVEKEDKVINYIVVRKLTNDLESIFQIVKYDLDGNEVKVISNDNISDFSDLKVEKSNDGFLLYGITSEVKLKKGGKSYFLIKYNLEDEEEWEYVGTRAIDIKKKLILIPVIDEDTISYFLMYTNKSDSSNEIVKISSDGILEKKVKKIKNDYYDFENFYTINDVLYFIGQINCPEDDNCDYDANSLFLISDEDKVIEVEEEDNTSVIIIISIVIVILIAIPLLRRKRKLEN